MWRIRHQQDAKLKVEDLSEARRPKWANECQPPKKIEPKERIKDFNKRERKLGLTPNKQLNGNRLLPQPLLPLFVQLPPLVGLPFVLTLVVLLMSLPSPFSPSLSQVRGCAAKRRRRGARDRQLHVVCAGDAEAELCAVGGEGVARPA